MHRKISNALFTAGMCLTVAAALYLLILAHKIQAICYVAKTLATGMMLVTLGVRREMQTKGLTK